MSECVVFTPYSSKAAVNFKQKQYISFEALFNIINKIKSLNHERWSSFQLVPHFKIEKAGLGLQLKYDIILTVWL